MREKDVWADIHKHWPRAHCVRIENSASFGDPDTNVCYQGVEFWLELKIEARNTFIIRPTQLTWIAKRLAAGAKNVLILTYEQATNIIRIYDPKFLFAPGVVTTLNSALKVSTIGIYPIVSVNKKDGASYNNLLHEITKYCTSK
jgi:hypothetical protein